MQSHSDIQSILESFEQDLNPVTFTNGFKGATIIGYGEISSVLAFKDVPGLALKRMPLFVSKAEAEGYVVIYDSYCRLLEEAGLTLPESSTQIIEIPNRPVVMYLKQREFPMEKLAHHLIHHWSLDHIRTMFKRILIQIENVWEFSQKQSPGIRIALDAQLSNWIIDGDPSDGTIYYIDTSTPLFQINGQEQLNPELFLKSAMPGLRWIIRKFFLTDVINRYYDKRSVMIDLVANLYKEQYPQLIPMLLELVNNLPGLSDSPISQNEVKSYYQEDKRIWKIVQFSRRMHRWGVSNIKRGRYEFFLPGSIKR
ncbi:MAG: hypothetical protein HQ510_11760 [Candidatus Marinimicrobia bacterium]|nr:hypothetical protein [Candidatus Neomarinimicrobiota bacterium]